MHTTFTPLRLFPLMLALLLTSACGYMDRDLLLEEEAFNASLDLGEEHITMSGLHLSGTGSSGCGFGVMGYGTGGGGTYGYRYGKRYKASLQLSDIPSNAGILALGAGALANGGGLERIKDKKEEEEEVEAMSPEDVFILNHTTVEAIAASGSLATAREENASSGDLEQE